jgi:lipoprotein-anchoring transpeptidase ErfK/SrfK
MPQAGLAYGRSTGVMSEVVSIHAARSASTVQRSTTPASSPADGNGFSAALADARKRPKGEKVETVAGHHYAKIVAGPDKDEYLNRTGNARDGEAFRIVQRGGRTFHVYGSDEDRKVFELPHGKQSTGSETPTGGTPAA